MHTIKATLTEAGKLMLQDLPYNAGDTVEVIVVKKTDNTSQSITNSLKGTVIEYSDPFESALDANDWEVLK